MYSSSDYVVNMLYAKQSIEIIDKLQQVCYSVLCKTRLVNMPNTVTRLSDREDAV